MWSGSSPSEVAGTRIRNGVMRSTSKGAWDHQCIDKPPVSRVKMNQNNGMDFEQSTVIITSRYNTREFYKGTCCTHHKEIQQRTGDVTMLRLNEVQKNVVFYVMENLLTLSSQTKEPNRTFSSKHHQENGYI